MSTSDSFDLTDLAWPSDDDDLFDTSGPWTGHAVLDWQGDTVVGRVEGYRRAAEVLVGNQSRPLLVCGVSVLASAL
jgi:hypothetical protein